MWPYPKVLAHRGGGKLAPENTLAAMRCGYEHGFRAVEFDVMLTSDGVPILMHDDVLGRTVPGSGSIADISAADLRARDAGSWFGAQFAGEPVPLFADVALFCKEWGIWMNIEIKPVPGHDDATAEAAAKVVADVFAEEIAGGKTAALPLYSSFSYAAVQAIYRAQPKVPRAWLVDSIPSDWRDKLAAVQAVALHTNHKNLTLELAAEVKAAGYGLFCYTVNERERATEIRGWGVDGFCTDRIDLIPFDF
ncbi:MAG: glycerophosphodiester phosphodiesterase [Burkholderiaceae bacterium]|nr:glycerophosphodiester phosphodiesterase [Burkholderiaceae bacterium]